MSPPVKVAKEGMRKSLYIFRRDFRLYDNKGLTAACKNRYVESPFRTVTIIFVSNIHHQHQCSPFHH